MGTFQTSFALPYIALHVRSTAPYRAFVMEKGASITCSCGLVEVTFNTQTPCWCVECFCVDCYQKNAHFAKLCGCVQQGTQASHTERPSLNQYFPGKMLVTGQENLAFNRLREEGIGSRNCIASCCNSLLFVDHPAYQDEMVLLFPRFRSVSNSQPKEPEFWTMTKDWPEDAFNQFVESSDKLRQIVYYDRRLGKMVHIPEKPNMMERMQSVLSQAKEVNKTAPEGSKSFSELLADAGNKVSVLGLPPMVTPQP